MTELVAFRDLRQTGLGDNAGAKLGENSFLTIGKAAVEVVAGDQLEDGITKVLEALVIRWSGSNFRGKAGVGERFLEQAGIGKGIG